MVYNRTGEKNATVKTSNSNIVTANILPSILREGIEYPVLTIEEKAFDYRPRLTSLTIPNTVISIGNYALRNCNKLDYLSFPSSIEYIAPTALEGVGNLNKTNIENIEWLCNFDFDLDRSIEHVPVEFCGWGHLYVNGEEVTDIKIPKTVSKIGSYSFYWCRFITSVDIPSSVNSIGQNAFYACFSLESIDFPESIKSIGKTAFYCSGLTSLYIPKSVNTIDEAAFRYCTKLKNVTIDATANIPSNGFSNCTDLTTVTIGKSVPSIGYEAFARCENLDVVYCHSTTPPDAHSTSFNESYPEYMTLHVPAGTKHLYETAEVWKDFGMIVEDEGDVMGIDEVGTDMTENIDYSQPYDVYNMQGIRIGDSVKGVVPGLYVVRQGNVAVKIAVK